MNETQSAIANAIFFAERAMTLAVTDEERADYNRVANDLAKLANDVMRIEKVRRELVSEVMDRR